MNLKYKYFIFIGLIHAILVLLTFSLLKDNKLLFIPAEIGILFSLFLSYRIYRAFLRPLKLMQEGVDAIKDEDFNVTFTKTQSMEMDQLIEVYNKMILKIREERVSHREQHFFLEKLIEASPNGIIILNFDGIITTANKAARRMLESKDPLVDRSISEVNNPLLEKAYALPIESSSIISLDGWKKFKCHSANFIHRGFERRFLLLEELSSEILVTEKRAYGKVIRMMAHEVNNSIGAVNSILQSVKDTFTSNSASDEDKEMSNALIIAEERNDRLNHFMKNFADVIRLPEPRLEKVDLNEVIQRIKDLMKIQAAKKDIEFTLRLSPEPFWANIDIGQFEQVLINIVKNSIEAIDEKGKIEFRTEGKRLQVLDNGTGISEEITDNIFKPFYSSKPDGQGIGLTLIKEILHQHKIDFSLKSNGEGWTCFNMEFDSNMSS